MWLAQIKNTFGSRLKVKTKTLFTNISGRFTAARSTKRLDSNKVFSTFKSLKNNQQFKKIYEKTRTSLTPLTSLILQQVKRIRHYKALSTTLRPIPSINSHQNNKEHVREAESTLIPEDKVLAGTEQNQHSDIIEKISTKDGDLYEKSNQSSVFDAKNITKDDVYTDKNRHSSNWNHVIRSTLAEKNHTLFPTEEGLTVQPGTSLSLLASASNNESMATQPVSSSVINSKEKLQKLTEGGLSSAKMSVYSLLNVYKSLY